MSARKDDSGKVDLSLVPRIAVIKLAEAMEVGERKYGRYNYCGGMEASRMMGALLRHAFAWFEGAENDPDGQHHLGSVMACCAMILRQQELDTIQDNRFVKDAEPEEDGEPLYLVELDKIPSAVFRKAIDGKLVLGLPVSRYVGKGEVVWASKEGNAWRYAADFEDGEEEYDVD